jgi:hypothetical protein
VTPLPAGVLTGRGLPGTGCVQLRRLAEAVFATGYAAPVEVEVFNEEVWSWPGAKALDAALAGYRACLDGAAP